MRVQLTVKNAGYKPIWILFAAVFCLFSFQRLQAEIASRPIVIKNVMIFDGEKIIPSGTVIIRNGIIDRVGSEISIPDDGEIVDGLGRTLLPGLIDSHNHVWAEQNLQQSLVFGVTTVVDMFMDVKTMVEIKRKQEEGNSNNMAYLISAGFPATPPGGHGTQYGMPIPVIDDPEKAQDFVDARISEGSDFIKIIWDDGTAYGITTPTLDFKTVTAVIEAAHRRGKMAVIHAATLEQCRLAIEAGVDGLAHLFFNNEYDPEFGRKAADHKTFVIPTFTILLAADIGSNRTKGIWEDPSLLPLLMPNDLIMLKSPSFFSTEDGSYSAAQKALQQLKAEKVPILAGTDAPNPGTVYGASLHHELELLVASGMTPLEALMAATSVPAEIFGLKDRGRIRPGYSADLVLIDGDPLQDIKNTRRLVRIWRGGVMLDLDEYKASVKRAKDLIEKQREAPPPKNFGPGRISDFEGDDVSSDFGAGWSVSTDVIMGGKSTAEYKLIKGGAQGSSGSLLITGTVDKTSSITWAGAFFSPGPAMMSPANLSSKKSICFWARGNEKTFSVMIFAQSLGFMPAAQTFSAGPDWKEYHFAFEDFNAEGFDIMGIFVGATEPGSFTLQIDNVYLK